jgi:hypothetical protein
MSTDVLNLESPIAVSTELCSPCCTELSISRISEINQTLDLESTIDTDLDVCSTLNLELTRLIWN